MQANCEKHKTDATTADYSICLFPRKVDKSVDQSEHAIYKSAISKQKQTTAATSYPDVSLSIKIGAQRKAGRRKRARRLACFQDGGKINGGRICNF